MGGLCPFGGGGPGSPIEHDVAWAEVYLPTKWHLDVFSHLATTDMRRKLGLCPFWGGELGPRLT